MAAIFVPGQGVAHADQVRIAGFAEGYFEDGVDSLTYAGSDFDVTTNAQNEAWLNSPFGAPNFNNLGSFTLHSGGFEVLGGEKFTLQLTFEVPTGISGGGSTAFTASVYGIVFRKLGIVGIDFDNTPRLFTFSDGNVSGSFKLEIIDDPVVLTLNGNPTASVHARITDAYQGATSVPEPATLVLLGIGLIGVACARRSTL